VLDDVVYQIKMELLPAGGLPIDDEHPETTTRKMLQKAALGQEIEEYRLISEGTTSTVGATPLVLRRRAVIEQLCRAVVPHHRWRGAMAAIGMAAIGVQSSEVALGAVRNLDRDRALDLFSSERVELGREV
jgi:hypothetical protein